MRATCTLTKRDKTVSVERNIKKQKQRRAFRVRNGIKRHSALHRVSVFKSLQYIYAQLIDDTTHKTLASCSSLELKELFQVIKKQLPSCWT